MRLSTAEHRITVSGNPIKQSFADMPEVCEAWQQDNAVIAALVCGCNEWLHERLAAAARPIRLLWTFYDNVL
jgi:hypothetical protein